MRIGGIEIPDSEKTKIALTRIYGIGRHNVVELIKKAKIDPEKRAKDLTGGEVGRIINALSSFKTEGDLRSEIRENIQRLKQIKSYRGIRHIMNLPVRGQRTRVNARTKRGKRKTVGALTKEMYAKIEGQLREKNETANK